MSIGGFLFQFFINFQEINDFTYWLKNLLECTNKPVEKEIKMTMLSVPKGQAENMPISLVANEFTKQIMNERHTLRKNITIKNEGFYPSYL